MRRMLLSALLLCTLLLGSVWESRTVEARIWDCRRELSALEETLRGDDWPGTEEQAQTLLEHWVREAGLLNLFLRHGSVEEIGLGLRELREEARQGRRQECRVLITRLQEQLRLLAEYERCTLDAVL